MVGVGQHQFCDQMIFYRVVYWRDIGNKNISRYS